jgi:hypothetical protein
MIRKHRRTGSSIRLGFGSRVLGIVLLLTLAGCARGSHTSDPRLRPIDEMLNSELPQGTPKTRVVFFLNARGFPIENSSDARIVVAVVHHVDTATLQPATARVTLHFDASGKLTTYELAPAPSSSLQP